MPYNRAAFLSKAAKAALASIVFPSSGWARNPAIRHTGIDEFGIQLWSVRKDMALDPVKTLAALSQYGYRQIESFADGDPMNMFWGMKPMAFKNYIDTIGLLMISTHCDADYTLNLARRDEFRRLAGTAAETGVQYLINPFMIQLATIESFKRAAEQFNLQGEICKRAGLRFGYHNHNYSFRKMEGVFPQDILMQYTDASLVDFEMDIYWVVDAGQDPVHWLKKYPGRFRLCHIKDRYEDAVSSSLIKNEIPEEPALGLNVSCELGSGKIDFHHIIKAAINGGMQYILVEQERFDLHSPMESARINAKYTSTLLAELARTGK